MMDFIKITLMASIWAALMGLTWDICQLLDAILQQLVLLNLHVMN